MCEFARKGLPIGRAAALVGIHRVTAQSWLSQGAIEIAEAGDEDGELGPRAAFAISFEAARAEYIVALNAAWQAAIARKDPNVAKAVAVMLASVSPDEYSERRVVRSVDQRTQVSGEIGVSRFSTMSAEDLSQEREKIAARLDAQALGQDDDWRAAAVRLPGEVRAEDIDPATPLDENPTWEKSERSLSTRKPRSGALPGDEPGFSHKNIPSRALASLNVPVVDDPADVVATGSAPGTTGEGGVLSDALPSPGLPASIDPAKFLAGEDDETKL